MVASIWASQQIGFRFPVAPGPLDRIVPSANGLDNFSSPYTASHNFLVIRIVARMNSAVSPVVIVNWGSTILTKIADSFVNTVGTTYCGAFYAPITPGTQNLTVTVIGGSLGLANIRISELVTLTGVGMVGTISDPSPDDSSFYAEIDGSETDPGNSIMHYVVGWGNATAYPIKSSWHNDTVQYDGFQTDVGSGISSYFGIEETPSGVGGEVWLWFTNTRSAKNSPNAIAFELIGATLP